MGSQNDFHVLGRRIDLPPSPTVPRATPVGGTIERDSAVSIKVKLRLGYTNPEGCLADQGQTF